ncbi:IS630 family transposase [Rhizophagus clarus]|uniref:IS630 family transposase n=1 Tax=Rhizophagus clarus TaxID=94130 RepID=A0A8H3L269_9GLOM|nr:IS630 family transposase [Rhizophagus clarus]
MTTIIRNKYRKILKEAEAVRKANLIQKELIESESGSDYEVETNQLILTKGNENDSNGEVKNSNHVILQDITISNIFDIIMDDLEADFLEIIAIFKMVNFDVNHILRKIIKEYPDYYLNEIVEEITRETDESVKDENTLSRHYKYLYKNQIVSKKVVFLRSTRYTILPALTLDGVLVMDNIKIHYDDEMVNVIERSSCKVLYLPSYLPDYNLIETAFSTVKTWIKKNRDFMETYIDPEFAIMAACLQITSEMAKSYFEKSNYI